MTVIEVYADIWCPFTHVGLRGLTQRRDEVGADAPLRVHPWPLELVNGKPMDVQFIRDEIDDLQAQVSPDLFAGFRADTFPTSTLAALALAEAAYRQGLAEGEAMSLLLRAALFEQGRNVGDPAVLTELAASLGVPAAEDRDRAAVETSWATGKHRGVVGSPHFFTPSGDYFCPALDIERVDGHLVIKPDLQAFEEFVAGCFV
ncbi:MAG: DsbA family protein [Acidimicrobiia bacterium]|nr:DsbA family protein [Acidimicrobiia bacterium]